MRNNGEQALPIFIKAKGPNHADVGHVYYEMAVLAQQASDMPVDLKLRDLGRACALCFVWC